MARVGSLSRERGRAETRQRARITPAGFLPVLSPQEAALAHLYRRAGVGATPADLAAAVGRGYAATVDHLVDLRGGDAGAERAAKPGLTPAWRVDLRDSRDMIHDEGRRLSLWCINRMAGADRPLREKLPLLIWHDHFATSLDKVNWPSLLDRQLQTFRTHGWGDFRELVRAVAKDPAMLLWLDGARSHGKSPNENFARELMELFTLGTGNYTELDVREAARALTGWRVDHESGATFFKHWAHDGDAKTVLGVTGALDADAVVDIVCNQPAMAPHVVARLWSRLARPAGPADPTVRELAAGFARDRNVGALLRAMFLHPDFMGPACRSALAKTPVEWLAGLARAARVQVDATHYDHLRSYGQVPLWPPNVAGWPDSDRWLSAGAAMARWHLAAALAAVADVGPLTAAAPGRDRLVALGRMLGVAAWSQASTAALNHLQDDPRELLAAGALSPEYAVN